MNTSTTTNEESNDSDKYKLCPEFMQLAHLVLDGEATGEEEALFMEHIRANQDCRNHVDEEKQIRTVIKAKCGSMKVPESLIKLIKSRLNDSTYA